MRGHIGCRGKVRHVSRGKAEAAMRSLQRFEHKRPLRVYLCGVCKGYHVGHYGSEK
jgi:hypothetical protein